jgi:hypothetical protein
MEQWLIQNAVEVLLLILGGVAAFVKLQQIQDGVIKDVQEIRQSMLRHHEAALPHPGCPAHAANLEAIQHSIDGLKRQIELLDSRIYKFITKSKDDEDEG